MKLSAATRPSEYRAPAEILAAVEAAARREETPCGDGRMVWRQWGEGPPLVLLHGGGGAWSHWIRNIGPLAERHAVWAPDLPGLGDSDMPPTLSIPDIAEVVLEGLERVMQGRSFDLVGFSFGGPVATYVASRLGARVRHFVLAGSRFVLDPEHNFPKLVYWKNLEDPAQRLEAHRRNLEIMMIADPSKIDDMAVYVQSVNTPRARFYGPPLDPGGNLHRYLPQVRPSGSITGISGSDDQVAKSVMSRQEDGLKAVHPNACFHAIPGAGHWVQYEAAHQFNRLLLDILSDE